MHQERHRERADQHHRPRRHVRMRVPYPQQRQAEPNDAAERERPKRGFEEQLDHRYFLRFAFATLSASIRNCRWSSIALSTMPTSTSSTDPLQNQSMMRCTAFAATFPRGWVAW